MQKVEQQGPYFCFIAIAKFSVFHVNLIVFSTTFILNWQTLSYACYHLSATLNTYNYLKTVKQM